MNAVSPWAPWPLAWDSVFAQWGQRMPEGLINERSLTLGPVATCLGAAAGTGLGSRATAGASFTSRA
jgi:hypothetical protein